MIIICNDHDNNDDGGHIVKVYITVTKPGRRGTKKNGGGKLT